MYNLPYTHTLYRLTPVYMLVLGAYAGLFDDVWARGPNFPTPWPDADNCRETWWTNLIYLNNLVRLDKPVSSHTLATRLDYASL